MGARLASLSSGLLARPGQAKPAMRPQVFAAQPLADAPLDDLGWNDMGAAPGAEPAPPSRPTPPVVQPAAVIPPVLVERAELRRAVTPPAKNAPRSPGRAAFTLRLDPDRHLRLRLASAVAGRSSQQLLVQALDAFLAAQPQVETLARQTQAFSGEKRS